MSPFLDPTRLVPALLGLALMVLPVAAMAAEQPRQMTLTGQGSVSAEPDMAGITIGAISLEKTAADALSRNNRAMALVMAGLKEHGVADRDLQTSGFTVSPRYHHDPKNHTKPPELVGYQVANTLHVRVRDLKKLGAILDEAVRHGSNQVNSIEFSISETDKLMDEARRLATKDALDKAKLYAEAAGVTLGPISQINEAGRSIPRRRYARTAAAKVEDSVPVAAGEQELSVSVNITWQLQ